MTALDAEADPQLVASVICAGADLEAAAVVLDRFANTGDALTDLRIVHSTGATCVIWALLVGGAVDRVALERSECLACGPTLDTGGGAVDVSRAEGLALVHGGVAASAVSARHVGVAKGRGRCVRCVGLTAATEVTVVDVNEGALEHLAGGTAEVVPAVTVEVGVAGENRATVVTGGAGCEAHLLTGDAVTSLGAVTRDRAATELVLEADAAFADQLSVSVALGGAG